MKTVRAAVVGATALAASLTMPPAAADASCSVGDGPVAAGAHTDGAGNDGLQGCVVSEYGEATVTVTPSYVVVDGSARNQEPFDGYSGVDETGPVGCASGDYTPGGANNSLLDGEDACQPQLPA